MRARVIGSNSLGWVEVLEGWGAKIEAVVVSSLDCYSHIRALVTTAPTMVLDLAYLLPPCGPWDGCLAANIITTEDARVISVLFKQWLPAVSILSIPGALSRSDTLILLPVGLPSFYQKKIITVHHPGVSSVTSTTWQFMVYSQWIDVIPTFSIMTDQALWWTLQTALSDVVGASGECNFEYWEGVQPPEAIGTVTSSGSRDSSPLFSGEALGPILHVLPFEEVHFWVRAVCVYSKTPVVWQVKTAELFTIWDYEV